MRKIEQVSSRANSLLLQRKQRKGAASSISMSRKERKMGIFGFPIIEAPVEINLVEGSVDICTLFFDNLSNLLKENHKCIYISFKKTSCLKAMPLLVIYSIIDEIREDQEVKTKINIIWSKRSKGVNAALEDSGSFELPSYRESKMNISSKLPVIMGNNVRANSLSNTFVDFILDNYFPDADAEKEQQISSAIQETVDNVGRHAYPDTESHEQKRWWFNCRRFGDNLYIVIYDTGIGIPSSLSEQNAVFLSRINALYPDEYKGAISDSIPENTTLDKIKILTRVKLLKKRLNDGQLIRAAMHTDVTSTDLEKHGQGSKSIKGLITDNENSYLLMLSNYGFYSYSKNNKNKEQTVENNERMVPGTLIQWSI